ncbi:MAG: hypothetical protein CVU56_10250 [Deltaproteobacteria bacterium HGW-Deltaproteobacteria-14]|jgi:uncharacterized membrane protein|nr:MAG: hypothetical protein CVU56_10250 [Deltaproteobacteria bacterium HGW-Deltaproteobacteria-14]
MIAWLVNIVRGMCMGIADAIPGVSGGTIALILGIYERFIGAISQVGAGLVRAVFTRAFWRQLKVGFVRPTALVDAPTDRHAYNVLFLGSLVVGIGAALVIGSRFIPDLLAHYPAPMNGFFMGLVLASIAIPFKMLSRRGAPQLVAFLAAAAATFIFVGLPIDQSECARGEVTVTLAAPATDAVVITPHEERVVFMTNRHGGEDKKREVAFLPARPVEIAPGATSATVTVVARLAGDVANLQAGELVTAAGLPAGATVTQAAATEGGANPALWFVFIAGMIAISAMVLPGISGSFVLLMLGLYNYIFFNLRSFVYDHESSALIVLVVFAAAVLTGVLSFSRFVNWLLRSYHDTTLAALVGIMVGSLRKLWPFTGVDAAGDVHPSLPDAFDSTVAVTLATFVAGVVIVLVLERVGRARQAPESAA